MGRSRYHTFPDQYKTYYVTSSIVNWIPLFAIPDITNIIIQSLLFLHTNKRMTFHDYVIMENHLHLIVSADDITAEMRSFKSFTAKEIVDYLKKNGPAALLAQFSFFNKQHKSDQDHQIWQEGFHPEAIVSDDMLRIKLEYIHNNPVRRGYVDDPAHWRYSSYRNYLGEEGILPVEMIGF